ncbi:glycosyl transferase, partial [bacterium]
YPAADWLKNALGHFSGPEIAAVGGPAITPESDTLRQKASGLVYSSPLVSAGYVYRYLPRPKRFVDDYPSCNFLVRRQAFREAGGFSTGFWPGEDTVFCLKIARDLKKKIVYDPKVLVYHHRRSLFYAHLKQIANYATHRGYFVKKFPETSLRPAYFIPSLFIVGLMAGLPASLLNPTFKIFYNSALFFYLTIVLIFSLRKDFRLIFLVFWGIIFSHLIYGLFFIRGLFSGKLKEE